MAMLQLLIIRHYRQQSTNFLHISCIFNYLLDIDTGPDPRKTENFVTQPDPTQPDTWMDPTYVQFCS